MKTSILLLGCLLTACSGSAVGSGIPSSSGNTSSDQDPTAAGGATSTLPPSGTDTSTPSGTSGNKRVFVTATEYTGYLEQYVPKGAKQTEAADALCALSAEAAGLGGTWTAWTATFSDKAIDRITGNGPWYTLDGKKVFNNAANLATTPLAPITTNEQGHDNGISQVWVATCDQGSSYGRTVYDGGIGEGQSASCSSTKASLYCFEE